MKIHKTAGRGIIAAGIGLALMGSIFTPVALAQNSRQIGGEIVKVLGGNKERQGEKNAMRNLGVGLGAAATYEAINKRNGSALVLGVGALLAGKKYEVARRAQNRENSATAWRRQYRYENGKAIGYYALHNGEKKAYYRRLRDSDGDLTSRYKVEKWY